MLNRIFAGLLCIAIATCASIQLAAQRPIQIRLDTVMGPGGLDPSSVKVVATSLRFFGNPTPGFSDAHVDNLTFSILDQLYQSNYTIANSGPAAIVSFRPSSIFPSGTVATVQQYTVPTTYHLWQIVIQNAGPISMPDNMAEYELMTIRFAAGAGAPIRFSPTLAVYNCNEIYASCTTTNPFIFKTTVAGSSAQQLFLTTTTNTVNPFYSGTNGSDVSGGTTYARYASYPISVLPANVVTLPVSLVSIWYNKTLNWTVAQGYNAESYDIETSADGAHFEKVATVLPVAFQGTQYTYNSSIPGDANAHTFVRLKMTEKSTNIVTYSQVLEINADKKTTAIKLYPNPAHARGVITLELMSGIQNQAFEIEISDLQGRVVFKQTHQCTQVGLQKISIPLSGLSNGIYTATVFSNEGKQDSKLIITD